MQFSSLIALLPFLAVALASPVDRNLGKRYNGVRIKSNRNGQCLSVPGDVFGDGVRVQTVDCANAQKWNINPGSGSVIHVPSGLALDAGTGKDNNEIVKLWTSYPTLFQQTWYLTGDNRIAITGGDQCLDQGSEFEGTQTWKCTTGNTNQIWFPIDENGNNLDPNGNGGNNGGNNGGGNGGSTPSPNIPKKDVYDDPTDGSHRLHPVGRDDLCVTVDGAKVDAGTQVNIAYCAPNDSENAKYQLFSVTGGQKGEIKLRDFPDKCLNSNVAGGNGQAIWIDDCNKASETQRWDYTGDKLRVDNGGNICLDVVLGSGKTAGTPYDIEERLQTWECFEDNTNQIFTIKY
ncbi:uncharacterized protein I206_101317 [Kwoniella pini CBS 10737]|uniref:Ricin B lectin domain-containing protein n=1 Tax=Kwoniella pini CBS 10737 TaxID=1296096 RepID=A0A1B9IBD5_9TREE|nr:uncharacterized protein I206_00007 [Kwoniella pini CBS 10737]OCF52711.1 hypothetical protein I206_00007 [Kwoniella pini CBS 10737]